MIQTDEACPDYGDILRNFELAHDWLWEEFKIRPTVGWQIDPFGHSSANAELMVDLGLEALFIWRINE